MKDTDLKPTLAVGPCLYHLRKNKKKSTDASLTERSNMIIHQDIVERSLFMITSCGTH